MYKALNYPYIFIEILIILLSLRYFVVIRYFVVYDSADSISGHSSLLFLKLSLCYSLNNFISLQFSQ